MLELKKELRRLVFMEPEFQQIFRYDGSQNGPEINESNDTPLKNLKIETGNVLILVSFF